MRLPVPPPLPATRRPLADTCNIPQSLATLIEPPGLTAPLRPCPQPPVVPLPVHPISPGALTHSLGGTYRASFVVPTPVSSTPAGSLLIQVLSPPHYLRTRRVSVYQLPSAPTDRDCGHCPPFLIFRRLSPFLRCCSHWPCLFSSPSAYPTFTHTYSSPFIVSTLSRQRPLFLFPHIY